MSNTLFIALIALGIFLFPIVLNELYRHKKNQEETNKIIADAYDKFWGDKNGHS